MPPGNVLLAKRFSLKVSQWQRFLLTHKVSKYVAPTTIPNSEANPSMEVESLIVVLTSHPKHKKAPKNAIGIGKAKRIK